MNLCRSSGLTARCAILVTAFFMCGHNVNGQAAAKHPVRLDDLSTTAMSDSLQLSPDGRMLAYSFSHVATYLTDSDLWLVETMPEQVEKRFPEIGVP